MLKVEYLKNLKYLMPIIYPSFYTRITSYSDELVFLYENASYSTFHTRKDEAETISEDVNVSDKTQCEAISNHFHLFEKVGKAGRVVALEIGTVIARNLLNALTNAFPDKKFIVYLELNIKDTTAIRFHQAWDDESPYFDVAQPFEDGTELYEFKT
ncbi:MAG: hypothetical protein FWC32_00260 [Firmicutes bacterium]|nr:hypothetical protein [Bacillota bacterium]